MRGDRIVPTDTCSDCRFWWREGPVQNPYRLCRRFPKYHFRGPRDWCGEYEFSGRAALEPADE